jgi:ABC-type phosphate/phosphonate transport system substrate-binding protein
MFFSEEKNQKTFASRSEMSIASFPMYDLPELQAATDALWAAIAARVPNAPKTLTRTPNLEKIWTDPDLLLAQTCGYPLVTSLAGKVALLATPCYDATGCEGPAYRSAIITHVEQPASTLSALRGKICAINSIDSNSGMNLLRAEIAPLAHDDEKFFARIVATGSHASSVEAVADGHADIAAIDCITWALLQEKRPTALREIHLLGWTQSTPGLPLITSLRTSEAIRSALIEALHDIIADPDLAPIRTALRLERFVVLPHSAYDRILDLERSAIAAGYPILR